MTNEWTWTTQTAFPSRLGEHLPVMDEILGHLERLGWEGRDFFGVQMTLEESLTNAIRHGNKSDPAKLVRVVAKVSPDNFWMSVTDEGPGFRPDLVADCTCDENLERCGGRGMLLINAFMTRVSFNDCGNCITVEKTRGVDGPACSTTAAAVD